MGRRTTGLGAVIASALLLAGPVARAATTPTFVGGFSDFNSPAWRAQWGIVPDNLQCKVAVGSASCNWGYSNLKAVDEPGTPGGAQALHVGYPAPSGPPSCNCGIGGAQLYQDLKMSATGAALVQSSTIDLKYHYNFPVGFDFGKNTAGKMPGLYGGPPGCESGGVRCDKAWSTRYMWRGGSASAPKGEVYFYTASGSGFGEDLGVGSWNFIADGKWHSIEQLVDLKSGKITVWHDGMQKFTTTQKFGDTPLTGIFFSTFHGGHDTGWSPSKATAALFANFTLSTEGPQTEGSPVVMVDSGAGGESGAGSDASSPPEATGGSSGSGGSGPGETNGSGGNGSGGASGGSSGGVASGGSSGSTTGSGGSSGSSGPSSGSGGGSMTSPPASGDGGGEPAKSGCSYGSRDTRSDGAIIAAGLGLVVIVARRRRRCA